MSSPRWYSLYGFIVQSDFPLPLAPLPEPVVKTPNWLFRRAEENCLQPEPDGPVVATLRCEHGTPMIVRSHGPGGDWLWHRAIGTCHILAKGQEVVVYPNVAADEETLSYVLAGRVSNILLRQLGHPTLHASAIATEHGAVAFLGQRGQGKSTLAAFFLRHGAALISDDVLPLRWDANTVYGEPGLPLMKVWRETAEHGLGLTDDLPNLTTHYEKKLLTVEGRYPVVQSPAKLRNLYVLNRYNPEREGNSDVTIRPMTGLASIAALLSHSTDPSLLEPAEAAQLLPLYAKLIAQAPVRQLRYPHGFEFQECVLDRVIADIQEGTPGR